MLTDRNPGNLCDVPANLHVDELGKEFTLDMFLSVHNFAHLGPPSAVSVRHNALLGIHICYMSRYQYNISAPYKVQCCHGVNRAES